MPEPKFHQKIAWFNFICCLMVIWTHSGNADLFFPELGQDAPWWHFQYPVMQEILRVDTLRQSFTLKDNANERNESWLSNCRVQLIFCKTIIK